MEVITIDSIAFQKLVEQLNRIESYVERTTELYRDIDDALEISTKDLMTIFCISESTLYRWRKGGSISFRYTETGWRTFFIQFPVHGNKVFPHKDSGYG